MPFDAPNPLRKSRTSYCSSHWIVDQKWEDYSAEEHETWAMLFERQRVRIEDDLIPEFRRGLTNLELPSTQIPDIAILNERLHPLTGWNVVAVSGLIPERDFFALLAARKFPSGRFIRSRQRLDYIAEPDVFHDVFGHVPMLADPAFADVTERLGSIGLLAHDEAELLAITRLYWFTVEFGLVHSACGLKAFGAGLASSPSELGYALRSDMPVREPFSLESVICSSYRFDDVQPLYFVIPSFDWLLGELRRFDLGAAGSVVRTAAQNKVLAKTETRLSAAKLR